MPIARSSLAGATTGVVLLAGALGLGVGLPKLTDEQYGESAELPQLPDRLGERFIAFSALTPDDVNADNQGDVNYIKQVAAKSTVDDAAGNDALAEVYGEAATRAYVDVEAFAALKATGVAPAVLTVTIIEGGAGPVIPFGPVPSDQEGGSHYRLETIGGYPCAVAWSDPLDPKTGQPNGQEPTAASYQIECRAEQHGLAYDISTTGMTPDDVVTHLEKVLELE